jgi:protein-disulfide isomerase
VNELKKTIYFASALALLLAGCGGSESNVSAEDLNKPLAQIPAPQGDWTQVTDLTPQNGFRMGNPNAPVKLVEYASLSCPFCAKFDKEGVPTLRDKYVKSGQVSWEYRTYMNHPTDPAISVLVHCQGPGPFFAIADQLYATQEEWYGRVGKAPQEQLAQLENLPPTQRNMAIAKLAGFDEFFRKRGMPTAKFNACLADPAMLEKVGKISELGNKDGISGTPNFLINGKLEPDASDWKTLEPMLRAAIP